MTIQVSTQDARTAKALALLETAPTWLKIRRKSDGVKFYVLPGSNGHVYWTNLSECSCPDHQHRGESVTCKHRLAVALRVAQLKASKPKPEPRQELEACGLCDVPHPCHCPRLQALCDRCPPRRPRVPLVGRITA
jgi:hypothetical protein